MVAGVIIFDGVSVVMPMDPRPITKRFPGQHCIRSTIWLPDKTATKHSHKIGFEGRLHPTVAEAILALQLHQGHLTPVMLTQLQVMMDALRSHADSEKKDKDG